MEPSAETLLRHADFLKNLARKLLDGSSDLAEDAVQDTMVAALQRPPAHQRNVRGWLATVTANFARMRRRAEARRRSREEAAARREATSDAASAAARLEIERKVVAAAGALPEPYRSTVVLRFFEGLSPKEIARRQGVPAETVRTRIKRALARLRTDLDASHDGDRRAWCGALAPIAWPLAKSAGIAAAGAILMNARWKAVLLILVLGGGAFGVHRAMRGDERDRASPRSVQERAATERTDGDVSRPDSAGDAADSGDSTGETNGSDGESAPGPGNIAVRVYGNGRPLPGARVFVGDVRVVVGAVGDEDNVERRTDASGRFVMASKTELALGFWHPDFGPLRRKIGNDGREARVDLPHGQAWTVRVVAGLDRRPVEGARVLLMQAGAGRLRGRNARTADDEKIDSAALMQVATTEDYMARTNAPPLFDHGPRATGEDGRVVFTGLPDGTADAIVVADGYLAGRARHGVVGGETVVRLTRGGSVEVRVSAVGQRSGAGLVCEVLRPGIIPLPVAVARLDSNGHAVLAPVPHGRFMLVLSGGGTSPLSSSIGDDAERTAPLATRPVDVRDGVRTLVEIGRVARCLLRGTVRGPGREKCQVLLVPTKRGESQFQQTKTDGEGRFVFEELPSGRYVVAAHLARGAQVRRTVDVSAAETDVELVAGASGLFGQVLGIDGKPVGKGRLLLLRRPLTEEGPQVEHGILALQSDVEAQARIGEDGRYRIEGIQPGRYHLVAGVGRRIVGTSVEVAGGGRRHDLSLANTATHALTIRFQDKSRGFVLVRDARGGLAPMVVMSLDMNSDDDWTYHLPAGTWRIVAIMPGRAPLYRTVRLRRDKVETVTPVLGHAVNLTLRRDATSVMDAAVTLRKPDGTLLGPANGPIDFIMHAREWRTDGEGVAEIPNVAPGRYTILVNGKPEGAVTVRAAPVERTLDLD